MVWSASIWRVILSAKTSSKGTHVKVGLFEKHTSLTLQSWLLHGPASSWKEMRYNYTYVYISNLSIYRIPKMNGTGEFYRLFSNTNEIIFFMNVHLICFRSNSFCEDVYRWREKVNSKWSKNNLIILNEISLGKINDNLNDF